MNNTIKINTCNHPELKKGEVFWGNMRQDTFAQLELPSKRKGKTPLHDNSTPWTAEEIGHRPVFPVFISKADYIKKAFTVEIY